MLYVTKAALDTVLGANFFRQDLSPILTLLSTRPRPVSQFCEQVKAKQTLHEWVEQGRIGVAGAGGAAIPTYSDGQLPTTAAKAPLKPNNTTCFAGLTAQVTDLMAAVWTGGGTWNLATGEEVRLLTEAMDLETELATLDTLDYIEWLHISGDKTNPQGFAGGQCDGLIKWIGANGVTVATGGTSGSPATFSENMVKKGARTAAENYATVLADTMLVPPELIPDVNAFVGSSASRPVTITIDGKDPKAIQQLVGGIGLGFYFNGFSSVEIKLEPNLSPLFNPYLVNPAVIMYNRASVKQANLIPFGATPIAKTDTSMKKMVNCNFTQEHRAGIHAVLIPNVISSIT